MMRWIVWGVYVLAHLIVGVVGIGIAVSAVYGAGLAVQWMINLF